MNDPLLSIWTFLSYKKLSMRVIISENRLSILEIARRMVIGLNFLSFWKSTWNHLEIYLYSMHCWRGQVIRQKALKNYMLSAEPFAIN